ncbi:MAG: hypothetical protein JWP37_4415 [Mucilaginibacter sp.]|nr:hypothetical protein [Mucilaginibacter sp.]
MSIISTNKYYLVLLKYFFLIQTVHDNILFVTNIAIDKYPN